MEHAPVISSPTTLKEVMALTELDRRALDQLISRRLHSEVVLVNQIAQHIIHSGGKRLRPLVHLLSAQALGYQGTDHIKLASVIEFIHTATLLHDDVVDESSRRRGQVTAHELWGNAPSVLVGDFLYSRSFQLMVELENPEIMKILADTTNTIAAGEVLQLMQMGNLELSIPDYFKIISDKTACLFKASAELGAVLAKTQNPDAANHQAMMHRFGLLLGQCFQIADDVLDYQADNATLGKNIGDDLAEGKVTLPLILALQQGNDSQQALLRSTIENADLSKLQQVYETLIELNTLEQSMARARELADQAQACLSRLPNSVHKDALLVILDHAVHRTQ
jgi:octaprenyl-diphosphate synthase